MASGKLGAQALPSATFTTVYTVPSGKVSSFNVNVTNRGSVSAQVDIAISSADVPGDADFIEFATLIPHGGGILERSALVASAGEKVVVRSSTANCAVRIHGFEEAI